MVSTRSSGDYALRSNGVSPPPISKPKPPTHISRSVAKNPMTTGFPTREKLNAPIPPNTGTDNDIDELQGPWNCASVERLSRKFATAALSYLREQGHNFKLVRLGFYEGATIMNGALFHYNFKAKCADDPSAPVETFFAQLRYFRCPTSSSLQNLTVQCCVSLGKSVSLPDERDNCGCRYCSKYVYHPLGGCTGILWGSRERDQISKKKRKKKRSLVI